MMYEWDERKRLLNIEKHGMDFIDAVQLFDGRPEYTYLSPRNSEERFATVGEIEGRLWVVVWTARGENKRIISTHRADDTEIKKYCALFGKGD